MGERTLQGALTFLGFAISVLAVFYFAIEYIPRVSEWSQLASLIFLGLFFAYLGVYLRSTFFGEPFFEGPRLRWLRPPIVLYLLALFSGIVAEIRFLNIDDVPRPLKILISLIVGIGLIVLVARDRIGWPRSRKGPPETTESPPEQPSAPPPPRTQSAPWAPALSPPAPRVAKVTRRKARPKRRSRARQKHA